MFSWRMVAMNARVVAGALLAAGMSSGWAAEPSETGFLPEVAVREATRLEWVFAASQAADGARPSAELPGGYQSTRQRYQLYVPPDYKDSRPWPLVVFLSPGDDPLGWQSWQKVCEEHQAFFCAAYGAGNNCAPSQRVRVVLDMLDDVRRHHRIDPARTYLVGFAGGGRLACTLAFALPEYFGGVAALCGGAPPKGLDYLRHRARDRLSVAIVSGIDDFDRPASELYLAPLLKDLGIRSRLWVTPRMGHEMPPASVLAEVHEWLEGDLPRRLQDVRERHGLSVTPDEAPDPETRAERITTAAEAELRDPHAVYRAAALLGGVVARWDRTEAGGRAKQLLRQLHEDPRLLEQIRRQGGAEERQVLAAQARALDRFGEAQAARDTWALLAQTYPGTAEGEHASKEARRLSVLLTATPYLGLVFERDSTMVRSVVSGGPAARAGLRRGDQLVKLGDAPTISPAEVRAALRQRKPGDWLAVEVRRSGDVINLPVEIGTLPADK
jgi:pimeloyl-ACP methyl ester carboxylesterase